MFWQKKTLLTDAILLLPCLTQERRWTKIKKKQQQDIWYLKIEDEATGLVFGIVTKKNKKQSGYLSSCTMTWTTENLQTYGISIFLHFFAVF